MDKKFYLLIFLSLCFIPFSVSGLLNDSLRANYNLNNDTTDTLGVFSLSTTGTPTYVATCKVAGCFNYTGSNNHFVNITTLQTGNSSFSISLWVNRYARTSYHEMISLGRTTCTGGAANKGCVVSLGHYNDNYLWLWPYYGEVTTSYLLNNSVWQHIVWTYNNTDARTVIYVNTVVRHNVTNSAVRLNSTMLFIGGLTAGGNYYNGMIDEVSVWNRSLYNDEVATIYSFENSGSGYPWTSVIKNYSIKNQVNYNGIGVSGAVVRITDLSSNTSVYNVTNSSGGLQHYVGYNTGISITAKYYELTSWINNNFSTRGISNFVYLNSYD